MRRIFQTAEPLPSPIVVCDEPAEGSEVTRGTVVSGWAYSPAGIRKISVWLDGQRVLGRTELGLERPDVAQDHPEWPDAERSGFRYWLDVLPVSELAESVELTVVAEDGEGRRVEARRAVQVDELLLDPILVCDEPEDGSEVTLGTVVSGWAYSPAGIRKISVWLDGQRVLGRAELGLERSDVAEALPEWPNVLHSGFRYQFETLPVSAEAAELAVVAEDGRGRGTEVRRAVRRDRLVSLKEKLDSEMQELRKIIDKTQATKNRTERLKHVKRGTKKKLEVRELESELRAAQGQAEDRPVMGALPDFVIIGVAKGGTTFLYHLLTQHPLVEPAVFKELHFFDLLFDEGIEWYRRCFPQPKLKDGRRTITGEASPGYLWDTHAPQRMAEVIPHARLIALLRNPVDRIYSGYHWRTKYGQETRTFEETIESSFEGRGKQHRDRNIYVDHLQRWAEFFPREQMLVLKSEDLFDNPGQTLKVVLEFLDLPEWEPDASELENNRNTGGYKQKMDPATRRRLEGYFEPHNRRLYDYLGKDFGW